MDGMFKYPRTRHIDGSRLQAGDEDLKSVKFEVIKDKYIVVEEKVDGANTGISFDNSGNLLLQSRGHFLMEDMVKSSFHYLKCGLILIKMNLKAY